MLAGGVHRNRVPRISSNLATRVARAWVPRSSSRVNAISTTLRLACHLEILRLGYSENRRDRCKLLDMQPLEANCGCLRSDKLGGLVKDRDIMTRGLLMPQLYNEPIY